MITKINKLKTVIMRCAKLIVCIEDEAQQKQNKIDKLERQLCAITTNRHYFCERINDIAKVIGMKGKDHFSPDAILRNVTEIMQEQKLFELAFKHGIGWHPDEYDNGWHVVRWDNPNNDNLYVSCIEESKRGTVEWKALITAITVLVNQAESE